jgi:hypothetical protein
MRRFAWVLLLGAVAVAGCDDGSDDGGGEPPADAGNVRDADPMLADMGSGATDAGGEDDGDGGAGGADGADAVVDAGPAGPDDLPRDIESCEDICGVYEACGRAVELLGGVDACVSRCREGELNPAFGNYRVCIATTRCAELQNCPVPERPEPMCAEVCASLSDECGILDGLTAILPEADCETICGDGDQNRLLTRCGRPQLAAGTCDADEMLGCLIAEEYPSCDRVCTRLAGCDESVDALDCSLACIVADAPEDPVAQRRQNQRDTCITNASDCSAVEQCDAAIRPAVADPEVVAAVCAADEACGFFGEACADAVGALLPGLAPEAGACLAGLEDCDAARYPCFVEPSRPAVACEEWCAVGGLCGLLPEGQDANVCLNQCQAAARSDEPNDLLPYGPLFACSFGPTCDAITACLDDQETVDMACEGWCARGAECTEVEGMGGGEPADAGVAQPDAAMMEPDAAMMEPDAAMMEPDAAGMEADAAGMEADAAGMEPDMDAGAPEPDAAIVEPEPDAAVMPPVEPEGPFADPMACQASCVDRAGTLRNRASRLCVDAVDGCDGVLRCIPPAPPRCDLLCGALAECDLAEADCLEACDDADFEDPAAFLPQLACVLAEARCDARATCLEDDSAGRACLNECRRRTECGAGGDMVECLQTCAAGFEGDEGLTFELASECLGGLAADAACADLEMCVAGAEGGAFCEPTCAERERCLILGEGEDAAACQATCADGADDAEVRESAACTLRAIRRGEGCRAVAECNGFEVPEPTPDCARQCAARDACGEDAFLCERACPAEDASGFNRAVCYEVAECDGQAPCAEGEIPTPDDCNAACAAAVGCDGLLGEGDDALFPDEAECAANCAVRPTLGEADFPAELNGCVEGAVADGMCDADVARTCWAAPGICVDGWAGLEACNFAMFIDGGDRQVFLQNCANNLADADVADDARQCLQTVIDADGDILGCINALLMGPCQTLGGGAMLPFP